MLVYLNGDYVDRAAAHISVDDRGFLFGDGVYEVVRVLRGQLIAHERHMHRLARTLAGVQISAPHVTSDAVRAIAERLVRENGLTDADAIVYLQITRGSAPRTHHYPPAATPPTVFVSVTPFASFDGLREHGVQAIMRPDLRWGRCDLKTVNLLPNVMAKQEAAAAGAHEVIFVRDDIVTEGSSSNIFAVIDGELRTHPQGPHILPGITRELVFDCAAQLGIPIQETPFSPRELAAADELFLTNTTNDVMPIVMVDGKAIGTGSPGETTRTLSDAFPAVASATCCGATR